jgi:hypothetical protein
MKLNLIEHSGLISFGYKHGVLELKFRDGSVLRFQDVPEKVAVGLKYANSPIRYLRTHLFPAIKETQDIQRQLKMEEAVCKWKNEQWENKQKQARRKTIEEWQEKEQKAKIAAEERLKQQPEPNKCMGLTLLEDWRDQ